MSEIKYLDREQFIDEMMKGTEILYNIGADGEHTHLVCSRGYSFAQVVNVFEEGKFFIAEPKMKPPKYWNRDIHDLADDAIYHIFGYEYATKKYFVNGGKYLESQLESKNVFTILDKDWDL